MRRTRRGSGLERSLTLLRVFLLASALICTGAGVTLGWLLSHSLTTEALGAERTALARYADGVVRQLIRGNTVRVFSDRDKADLAKSVANDPEILSVKVWGLRGSTGLLAWTNVDTRRIGKSFPLEDELGDAIHDNRPIAALVGTGGHDRGEDSFERDKLARRNHVHQLFEVYAPIESTSGPKRAIGAYEIYADPRALNDLIGSRRTVLWLAVAGVFAALWGLLALLVRGASRTLSSQNAKLRERTARLVETNRLLEEGALEAVESLNATVDAKDPYTAGHSQRVQRIAVALGEELGLERQRLEVIRFAGLFHDIGKIAVPDAILTKPSGLTEREYEIVKRHPEDGARIIGRLHRLRDTVPAILHHHERWDGHGYPDRLRGEAIPLEAAIVGLADALDAMTTDRPYSSARSLGDASEEIVRNRGTQFAPEVVDAFVTLVERTPELFGTDPAAGELVLA